MEIKAQLIDIKPIEKGTSPQGEWRKQDLIVEVPDTFQRKVCINRWNSLIEHVKLEKIILQNQIVYLRDCQKNNPTYPRRNKTFATHQN